MMDGAARNHTALFDEQSEDVDYLSQQLVTYIGNKRALLGQIGLAVEKVKARLGKRRLRIFDAFSGSGVVSRYLKAHASYLASNDFEEYAAVIGRCYLRNRGDVDLRELSRLVEEINAVVPQGDRERGFIEELYAPRNEKRIRAGERVFYTPENARRLDQYRQALETVDPTTQEMLLGPLLSRASIHANTAGVFKGFYKNRGTGIGQFGGSGSDALFRIKGRIRLEVPLLSRHECECAVIQDDANAAARRVRNLDLAYLDPPYNQHPYGSNYFMLNLLVRYQRPTEISESSGIPVDWQRSGYNVRAKSYALMRDLLHAIDAPFLLVSFNNEGFISPKQMRTLLDEVGSVESVEIRYNAFRGSRNFTKRPIHVTEQLFLVTRN